MGPGQPKKIVLAGNLHKTGEIKAPHGTAPNFFGMVSHNASSGNLSIWSVVSQRLTL